ncbi:MAG: hypothetical protein ACK52I_12880 [Pseudomonadota bacterium]|jgi:hypothetical protein
MDNRQMIAGRFLRWARARKQHAWIVAQIEAGRTVYLTTATHSTKVTAKNLLTVKATRVGLMIKRGSRWTDYSLTQITAA